MNIDNEKKLELLRDHVYNLYKNKQNSLPFHGWHHIDFVRKKALVFAHEINANLFLVESSALIHDINYLVNPDSNAEIGQQLRKEILIACEYTTIEIEQVEYIVISACITKRLKLELSNEAKALSDADTLFKALPITPILFASRYLIERNYSLEKLTQHIFDYQIPLFDENIYFYTNNAKQYLHWAKTNLDLWKNVQQALEDKDIKLLINEFEDIK